MLAENGEAIHPACGVLKPVVPGEKLQRHGFPRRSAETFGILADEDENLSTGDSIDNDVVKIGVGKSVHGRMIPHEEQTG
jgi:hypothetical protein